MKVLTIYAHHNPHSLCHAVLEQFCAGLKDGGHSNEVVDLHAIGFGAACQYRLLPGDDLVHQGSSFGAEAGRIGIGGGFGFRPQGIELVLAEA